MGPCPEHNARGTPPIPGLPLSTAGVHNTQHGTGRVGHRNTRAPERTGAPGRAGQRGAVRSGSDARAGSARSGAQTGQLRHAHPGRARDRRPGRGLPAQGGAAAGTRSFRAREPSPARSHAGARLPFGGRGPRAAGKGAPLPRLSRGRSPGRADERAGHRSAGRPRLRRAEGEHGAPDHARPDPHPRRSEAISPPARHSAAEAPWTPPADLRRSRAPPIAADRGSIPHPAHGGSAGAARTAAGRGTPRPCGRGGRAHAGRAGPARGWRRTEMDSRA